MKKILPLIMIFLFCGWLQDSYAQDDNKKILFIHSYSENANCHNDLEEALRRGLTDMAVSADVYTEHLNAESLFFSEECEVMREICERARQRGVDAIVTVSDEAFFTLMNCGDSLGYQLPVVVSAVKYPPTDLFAMNENVCGITTQVDMLPMLEEAARIFPDRKNFICISDSSQLGVKGGEFFLRATKQFEKENKGYTFSTYNLQTSQTNEIIRSVCYPENAQGKVLFVPKWTHFLSFIGRNSKAPVFACEQLAICNGVLAAYDAEYYDIVAEAGRFVGRIFRGVSPKVLGVVNMESIMLYDKKQLNYFGIKESNLGGASKVINQTFYEQNAVLLWMAVAVVMVLMTLLVIWLYRLNKKETSRRIEAQTRLSLQQQLIEQRNEFNNIFSSIHDGLITYDPGLHIGYINRSLLKMLGLPTNLSEKKYKGKIAGSIFHIFKDGENILDDLLCKVCVEQKRVVIPLNSFMQENHSGKYFPVSGEVIPIISENNMVGVAIVCRNIGEEELMKRSFDLAIEESAIYPWQYDTNLNTFHFPKGLLQSFDTDVKGTEITREAWESLVYPEDLTHIRRRFDRLLKGHEMNLRISFRMRDFDGVYRWWEYRSTTFDGLQSDRPYMILGVCQSIQRYKDTEAELIAAREKAEQADKLKSAFLANMSHEIRTPLNAIVGFSDLLKNIDAFSKEDVQQFVDTININCSLLLALVNDVLDLSRIEAGTMEFKFTDYDLNGIMREVYESQRLSMPEEVELRLQMPEDTSLIMKTDVVRLKQVINNLINNAKKFTTQGYISIGYEKKTIGFVELFVEDTGKGMSQEALEHIFERFYKVDSFTQGAGLGLSICQTFVDRMSGTISVTSEVGKGTRFVVKLPI
ncbi:MAG: PAS domain-containing protein [Bacteroides sp.]|nr:PAS domain-containing protein [Bacteroides sp.]